MISWYMDSGELAEPGRGTAFHRWLGLRWTVDDGPPVRVVVELDLRPELCGPAGSLEGGLVATLVDVAGATATARGWAGRMVATEHISLSFVAPGRVGPVTSEATVIRAGRRDAVAEVRVTDQGHGARLMAVALITVRALDPR
jgi:uncharacterized protein (TIGR00369 family)